MKILLSALLMTLLFTANIYSTAKAQSEEESVLEDESALVAPSSEGTDSTEEEQAIPSSDPEIDDE